MSSALQDRKRNEAKEALKQGNKCLEKTMFRWHPDYLSAAPLFEKAAEAFRSAGDLEMAKKVFAQAAVVQNKNKSAFRAAQNCENAAKIVVQQIKDTRATGAAKDKLLEEMKKSYEAACSYYSDMGELGKAADALLKGATSCEENGMADVRELYMRACSLMEAQGKPHFAVDVFRKTLSYLVKAGLYQESVALLQRQVAIFLEIDQRANIHKCYLSEIILLLVIGDVAAADKTYMDQLQSDDYLKSDECALAEDLVRAFKLGNEELLQQTIRKQGFSFLDNQIGRLVRTLSLFGNAASASPASASRTSSRSASGNQTQQQRAGSSSKPNPFAPAVVKDRYAYPQSTTTPRPAPVAAAPVVATAPSATFVADTEYDFSMKSTATGTESEAPTVDFDFDSLSFATEPHAAVEDEDISGGGGAHNALATAATEPSVGAPQVREEEEFDLT